VAPVVIAVLGAGGLLAAGVVLVYFTPDKAAVWGSWIYRFIAWVLRRVDHKAVALHLEGRFNGLSTDLARRSFSERAQGVRVEWVGTGETQSHFLEQDRVVLRLQPHRSRDRNFVLGGMAVIAATFAVRGKRLLSQTQRRGVDLHAARAMFEIGSRSVADLFYEEVFGPALDRDQRLAELAETLDRLDKAGLFFPVATQELMWLGRRVYVAPKDGSLITEAGAFLEFLARYAERRVGDEGVPLTFAGRYFKCAIIIVAKSFKRELGDIAPWVSHAQRLAAGGAEAVYLIGSAGEANAAFIERIASELCASLGSEWVRQFDNSYAASLIGPDGSSSLIQNYMISLRTSKPVRYAKVQPPKPDPGESAGG
jgi:hypothetical protein